MTHSTGTVPKTTLRHGDLNPEQLEAVLAPDRPILIVAGPGSGKTRVLAHRIAHLITERDVRPQHVVAMTFTNRAAAELQERISQMAPGSSRGVTAGTFHRYCGQLLHNRTALAGRKPDFTIYDRDDQKIVAQRALEITRIPRDRASPEDLLWTIGYAKAHLLDPKDLERHVEQEYAGEYAGLMLELIDAYQAYEDQMISYNAIDFDDMIGKAVDLLENNPATRRAVQSRHRHILVDEFQDTSLAQYRLTRALAGEQANLCVVGDPDQSIYGWRHADIRNILSFRDDFPQAIQVNLGRNYRSTKTIVAAAAELIRRNSERIDNPLSSERCEGPPITVLEPDDEAAEAHEVVEQLSQYSKEAGFGWQECAVLYRTHRQSRATEEECVSRGIPYRVVGGMRFYDREEIRDALGYLRLISNPGDAVAFQRVVNKPSRGVGAKTVATLAEWAERNGATAMQSVAAARGLHLGDAPKVNSRTAARGLERFGAIMDHLDDVSRRQSLVELFDEMVEVTELEPLVRNHERGPERWDNLQELREVCRSRTGERPAAEGDLGTLLQEVMTLLEPGQGDGTGALTLTSLHQAKGLEFEAVALIGMNGGVLPLGRAESLEEERRLCYVGMTRAKTRLILSWTLSRYGRDSWPSRFVDEIPSLGWTRFR